MTNVCNAVEGHCLQAMEIVRHHANSRFNWLVSGHQRVNPSREATSVLSGKYKGFTFVHPVGPTISYLENLIVLVSSACVNNVKSF